MNDRQEIARAQDTILNQLRDPSHPQKVSWDTLHGRQQLDWLRGGGSQRTSSENHPLFAAASQALAGDADAHEFWNLLAQKEMMGIELGVATVYSTWHWTLWAAAAEGFERHRWPRTPHIDRTMKHFAVLSALSAQTTRNHYDGGELGKEGFPYCRGPFLCLPWGKRGFERLGPGHGGVATHLFHNLQGWMLAMAAGRNSTFPRTIWEKDCVEAIGTQWPRLSEGIARDIVAWIESRQESALSRLLDGISDMKILDPAMVFEWTRDGLAAWAPESRGVGKYGTQPTQAASYETNTGPLYVITPGSGNRQGVPPSTVTETESGLRRGGGAPTERSLPPYPQDTIPKPGGPVLRRHELR